MRKSAPCLSRGKPERRAHLVNADDHTIVSTYGAEWRGIVQYYLLAGNVHWLYWMQWVMETSQVGNSQRLDEWIATARGADLPHVHAFTRGLEFDRDAVHAAVTLPYHNGGTEGVNTKTKRIMRPCMDEPASHCSATASCSTDLTHGHHQKRTRAFSLIVPGALLEARG